MVVVVVAVVVVVVGEGSIIEMSLRVVMSNTHEQLLMFIAFSICAVDDYDEDDDVPPEFSRVIDAKNPTKILQQVVQVSPINTN